jgi:hypothetical protein
MGESRLGKGKSKEWPPAVSSDSNPDEADEREQRHHNA